MAPLWGHMIKAPLTFVLPCPWIKANSDDFLPHGTSDNYSFVRTGVSDKWEEYLFHIDIDFTYWNLSKWFHAFRLCSIWAPPDSIKTDLLASGWGIYKNHEADNLIWVSHVFCSRHLFLYPRRARWGNSALLKGLLLSSESSRPRGNGNGADLKAQEAVQNLLPEFGKLRAYLSISTSVEKQAAWSQMR